MSTTEREMWRRRESRHNDAMRQLESDLAARDAYIDALTLEIEELKDGITVEELEAEIEDLKTTIRVASRVLNGSSLHE